jgi:hypothetical protein
MAFKRLIRDENLPYDYIVAGCVSEAQGILSSNKFDVAITDYLQLLRRSFLLQGRETKNWRSKQ